MKYMLIRKADEATERGELPSQDLLAAMAEYNEKMVRAGVFVDGNGLRPSSEGCRVEFHDGEPVVMDGPFTETKELLAGYSVLEVDSLEEAVEWAKQWPAMDNDGNARLELRRYFTMADFEQGHGLDKHLQQAALPAGLNVHLSFAGNCLEAMQFYAEVTGGHLEAVMTYADTPAAEQMPKTMQDKVIHASLNIRGRRLMGADAPAERYEAAKGMQVQLEYTDAEQAERVFRQLAEGGQTVMPFDQTFWAYRFGMAIDRFGVPWMINCEAGPGPTQNSTS